MPIHLNEENGGKTLAIHVTGKLAKVDYEHFVPEFERLVLQHGKLRLLFDLTGFHGWEAGALWDEIRFDIKYYADIERLAMVGDKKWQQGMAAFFKPFTKATSRYFDHADAAEARKWLDETPRPAQANAQMIVQAKTRADARALVETARMLVADDKGLLAMDESNPTCDKRFAKLGIPQTEKVRRAYRELIVTTPGLGECISGAILYDETIRQKTKDGIPFIEVLAKAGIVLGIKVDTGAKDLAGYPREKVTEGLDGLRDRLTAYFQMGARFAKWRAVIALGAEIPSRGCIEANAQALARYAALCQEAGLVPVVEPEVLMDGDHTLEQCRQVTEEVLRTVFVQLCAQRVMLEGMILKPNMVLPGLACLRQEEVNEVADVTVTCLLRAVPAAVPGIAFLSGGQSGELASARLNAMNVRFKSRLPWAVAFSFARAIQQPALEIWRGNEAQVVAAQKALYHRARCNQAARRGEYSAAMEKT
ncbi:MAG TPA: class I fructose-bisphosphate aldolase [Stellaceae bacterium]|nr:class I fructose-bisphosphate aldolase [Stellaceae bacterium]